MYEIIGSLTVGFVWLIIAVSTKNKAQIELSIFATFALVLGFLFGLVGILIVVGAYIVYIKVIKKRINNQNTTKH